MLRTHPDNKLLYLIASSEAGPVKVGISENPKKRLQQLDTSSPVDLRIFAVARPFNSVDDTPGSAKVLESTAHTMLAAIFEKRKEWFAAGVQEVLDAIDCMDVGIVWPEFFEVSPGLKIGGVER